MLLTFLSGSFPTQALATDGILDRLPRQPAIYFWTTDAPSLIAATEKLITQPNGLSFQESIEESIDTAIENNSDDHREQTIETLERLSAAWRSLLEDELFDGQAAMILPVDAVAMGDFSYHEHAPPFTYDLAFIAQSSHRKDQIADWLDNLAASTIRFDATGEERPGHWSFEDGWFCWTNSKDNTKFLLDYLTGRRVSQDPLTEDRSYQEVFAHLPLRHDHQSQISIFVTAEALPIVGWGMAKEIPKLRAILWNRWQDLQLDDTRGLGIRVSIGASPESKELGARLLADGFLLVTRPRHGVLRALVNSPDPGIDFDVPTLDYPLERFSQFNLDGEQLALGLAECRNRFTGKGMIHANSRDNVTSSLNRLGIRNIVGFTDLCYEGLASDFGAHIINHRDLSTVELVRYADVSANSLLADMSTDKSTLLRGRMLPTPLQQMPSDRVVVLGESEKSYRERLSSVPQKMLQIESIKQSHHENIDRLKELGRFDEQAEQSQEALKQLQLAIHEPFLTRGRIPSAVILDGWCLKDLIHVDSFQKLVAEGFGRQHPQLRDLQSRIDALQKFTGQESLCGVIAIWGPRILRCIEKGRGDLEPQGGRKKPVVAPWREEAALPVKQIRELAMTIDQLIVTMSSSDKGFEMHGALLQIR